MKIFEYCKYIGDKIKSYKSNVAEDEYGEDPKWSCIYSSIVGYFGIDEDELDNKVKELIEKRFKDSVYGDITSEAYKLMKELENEIHNSSSPHRFYSGSKEFIYKGVPCRLFFSHVDGLSVEVGTKYIIDNYDKMNIDIPELDNLENFGASKYVRLTKQEYIISKILQKLGRTEMSKLLDLLSTNEYKSALDKIIANHERLKNSVPAQKNQMQTWNKALNKSFSERLRKCFSSKYHVELDEDKSNSFEENWHIVDESGDKVEPGIYYPTSHEAESRLRELK